MDYLHEQSSHRRFQSQKTLIVKEKGIHPVVDSDFPQGLPDRVETHQLISSITLTFCNHIRLYNLGSQRSETRTCVFQLLADMITKKFIGIREYFMPTYDGIDLHSNTNSHAAVTRLSRLFEEV